MADDVIANPGQGGARFATDDDGVRHHPYTKIEFGADNEYEKVSSANPLPVSINNSTVAIPVKLQDGAGTGMTSASVGGDASLNVNVKQTVAYSDAPTATNQTAANVLLTQIDADTSAIATNSVTTAAALEVIDNTIKADDAAFTLTTDSVNMAGAVRDGVLATLAAAEGDATPLRVNRAGALWTAVDRPPGEFSVFGHAVTGTLNNQIDVQFYRDTPANLLTVVTANGGTAVNNAGGALFSTSAAATGEVKGTTAETTLYRSGAEVYVLFTAAFLNGGVPDCQQFIGLYDTNNGFFLGYDGATFEVNVRNNGSDTGVVLNSFSEDTLAGGAGSRFTRNGTPEAINFTYLNVFRIRFGWLGSAPVYWEVLSPDGHWVTFHITKFPNTQNTPSIRDADLPMQLHVKKTSGANNVQVQTDCWGAGVTINAVRLDDTVTDAAIAPIHRAIITAKQANGSYTNVGATNNGNLKVSLSEASDGLDIGTGNAGGETIRVAVATNDVNLSAIKTAVETLDNAISGNEMQVDVVGSLPAGTALIGKVAASVSTSGGTTTFRSIDLDETEEEVKSSAGQVYWVHAMNLSASVLYLKFYDADIGTTVVGTTTPKLTFPVPTPGDTNGAGFVLSIPSGIVFSSGITVAATTGIADADTGAPGANEMVVHVGFA